MRPRARRWAVVPAAGRGERFGGSRPKQYAPLLGRPMLSWTLRALLADRSVAGVMVAVAEADQHWRRIPESRDPRVGCCLGGATRAESVARALDALAPLACGQDWVLVHDAARPCLSLGDLRALMRAVERDPVGGLLAHPASDTLKRADGEGRSGGTLPREGVWRALTPQVFRYGMLRRALALCRERERPVTDEASAIEALGLRPLLVRGRSDNLKVTSPEDLRMAAAVLGARSRT